MNIIFLDIDGVLNSENFFINNEHLRETYWKIHNYDEDNFDLIADLLLLNIDHDNLNILKEIIIENDASVVITSSWKDIIIYDDYIKDRLINLGIPIIGKTKDYGLNRGKGIKDYIIDYNVLNYIIIDDETFKDFDEEILEKFIKIDYNYGLRKIDASKAYDLFHSLKRKK